MSNRIFCDDINALIHAVHQSPSHTLLLSNWNVTNETKELNFKFGLILINLNLNCHKWLVTTILNSTQYLHFTNGTSLQSCEGPVKHQMGKGFERPDGQHEHKLESWGLAAEAPLGNWNLVYSTEYLLPVPIQENLSQGVNKSSGSPEESNRRPGIH